MRLRLTHLSLAFCMLFGCTLPLFALAPSDNMSFNSDDIATSALRVAQSTRTTGRCYAAVSRALVPLSIDLHGAAAYEARDLLLQDQRFAPLVITSVDMLRRGDIIVFNRSDSHPYGHISVYQGDYTEASDHVSAITHTQAYGGAMVFRLRNELAWDDSTMPTPAPGYAPGYLSSPNQSRNYQPSSPVAQAPAIKSKPRRTNQAEPGYYKIASQSVKRALINRCAQFLLGNR